MMKFDYYILDVFTSHIFGGNQLAVVTEADMIPEKNLQKIAREFNFSETAFVFRPDKKENDYKMRIFTPYNEMPTAGHPTIGTAYVLLNELKTRTKNKNLLLLEQKVGIIPVSFVENNKQRNDITMSQPLPEFGSVNTDHSLIAQILSLSVSDLDTSKPIQAVSCGNKFLFIPIKTLGAVNKINIRTDLLKEHANQFETTEFYCFSFETKNPESTVYSRMFAPLFGIYEDPATGSASGPLGCYLVKNKLHDGENIICEQGFEMGRPSIIHVSIMHSDTDITKVKVSGEAVLVSKGVFFLP